VASEPAAVVLDAAGALGEAAELDAAIIHVPHPVGDGFEADGLLGTYEIAFEDSDRSGRLDHADAAELYISDLDGGNLRRVLPAGFRVRSTQVLPDLQLLVTGLDARNSERKPED
jgi:hypothetical protein